MTIMSLNDRVLRQFFEILCFSIGAERYNRIIKDNDNLQLFLYYKYQKGTSFKELVNVIMYSKNDTDIYMFVK